MITTKLYIDMIRQTHLLIAGSTGSGKSTLVDNLIKTTRAISPGSGFILIDPKRVDLIDYKEIALNYATEPKEIINALHGAINLMEYRYKKMARHKQKLYNGNDVYIVIDELADLMTTNRKKIEPLLIRLAQLGRAAKIHLWVCTQRPTSAFLTGAIKVNLTSRVALHCMTAQDSRNIIGVKGAETLPKYGQCIYITPDIEGRYNLPLVTG